MCRNIAIIDAGRIIENTSMRQLINTLHIETFVLDLKSPQASCPSIPGYTLRFLDELTLEADISKDCSINQLFTALSAQGIEVLSMRNKSNRLEQLFMHLVDSNIERQATA